MSPLVLRRYRAERLLQQEFQSLRAQVLGVVRARLRAGGARDELIDLEVCYAQAWQGLYAAVLDGQEIDNPAGWLALVAFRRAIDEHRAHAGEQPRDPAGPAGGDWPRAVERDLAQELDDRLRLRQVFEALRGRLGARERQAAALCYLQGLSRAEAATRMGISESRMTKLMEGRGPGRPGVASKVGALLATIRAGGWCEEQGSLMRGLAFGVLDPQGERYRLALAHSRECPACRAYVSSLRGLAAVLGPVVLPLGPGAVAGVGGGVTAGRGISAGISAGGGGAAASGATGAGVAGGAGAGAGAGGGWLFAGGSASLKLAAGCLLALGVGAGCVTIASRSSTHSASGHRGRAAREELARGQGTPPRPVTADQAVGAADLQQAGARSSTAARQPARASARGHGGSHPVNLAVERAGAASLTPAALEFGPERPSSGSTAASPSMSASSASSGAQAPTRTPALAGATSSRVGSAGASSASAASREFGIP